MPPNVACGVWHVACAATFKKKTATRKFTGTMVFLRASCDMEKGVEITRKSPQKTPKKSPQNNKSCLHFDPLASSWASGTWLAIYADGRRFGFGFVSGSNISKFDGKAEKWPQAARFDFQVARSLYCI